MDVFKFNWTQRIKTEPFVNATLNSKRTDIVPGAPRYINYWKVRSQDEWRRLNLKPTIFEPYYDKMYAKYRMGYNPRMYEVIKRNVENNNDDVNKYKTIDIEHHPPTTKPNPDAWENTRPQSLYNLRYASIR